MSTFRIRSNLTPAFAYRGLSKSQFNLQTTLERLSSGLRINRAANDSAGLLSVPRMSNQIRGMKQANKNSQQANRLIQMAESGLRDISGMLSRIRILGLKKLSIANLGDLTCIRLTCFLSYSHPPVLERISAMRDIPIAER